MFVVHLIYCILVKIDPTFDQKDLKMSQFVTSLVLVVLSCLSPGPGLVIIISGQGQEIDIKMLNRGDNQQCASVGEIERARNEIHQIVNSTILATICNGTPGWRRVAFINMTDTSYNCPPGLNLTSYSKRTCGRSHTTLGGCSSTTFSVGGLSYSRVCGRIRGYQFGATSAFPNENQGIDGYYVDGVSLTHGGAGSRQHIWTFAAGLSEVDILHLSLRCPCDVHNYNRVPAFVEDNFFCESGLHSAWSGQYILIPDVLWDGQNCTSTSTCCQLNNPPWFTKNLTNATTDDIELRICTSSLPRYDDVPLELIELYVQ